ncbi:MAG: NAD-dependent dehydratase [Candidatus Margulisiibacteriota bacterium]|nr:MAG: NAD-dependent dehydratase [Candidatus Margulisbacteria bacterium GWD2_39_127]OGI05182.1 MAG: NAD-dependent dehydratase [Candidatus Margulisbacteria bacterium GWF2_38_17]OGI06231.1 MAG: NAD-dependent dehydratase [Candidatus Margulisbacteria bacterium GWE2_39_32]PZM78887.1 MAG: NAD-dependent dehydratase [Candidatus Margulisiibacteriota bacterium]HAR64531.1 NAD-dependent dehydratase [Candidatus Margulisiibacteriota bacterium]
MNILVTGGAGFIGRWIVKQLLDQGHFVWVLDNLSNGKKENIIQFLNHQNFKGFVQGDIKNIPIVQALFKNKFDICYHLAASINVQDSIDDPRKTFDNDATGTLNVLESCKTTGTKIVYMSTCMVYDRADSQLGINELSPLKAASPYAGAKLAGEYLVQSYYYAYGLPAVIVRPFNTYGPYQKNSGEGGVVAIFISKELKNEELSIYGDGFQTRDLLYVEDCARFVIECGLAKNANGQVINAGTGIDVSINTLAEIICPDKTRIRHIPHIHPQSEIPKLLCDYSKANKLLSWAPQVKLEEGISRTRTWLKTGRN